MRKDTAHRSYLEIRARIAKNDVWKRHGLASTSYPKTQNCTFSLRTHPQKMPFHLQYHTQKKWIKWATDKLNTYWNNSSSSGSPGIRNEITTRLSGASANWCMRLNLYPIKTKPVSRLPKLRKSASECRREQTLKQINTQNERLRK